MLGLRGIGCGYGVMGSDTDGIISGYREPSGPGVWDQWNPLGLRGRTGEKDYREWFEFRFPNTIKNAKEELIKKIIKNSCSSFPLPKTIPPVEGIHVDPDIVDPDIRDNRINYYDKPQSLWERYAKIGEFWIKTDTIQLKWENPCEFTYMTTIFIEERTGTDPIGSSGFNFIPDFVGIFQCTYLRDVRMAKWPIEGKGCCEN